MTADKSLAQLTAELNAVVAAHLHETGTCGHCDRPIRSGDYAYLDVSGSVCQDCAGREQNSIYPDNEDPNAWYY